MAGAEALRGATESAGARPRMLKDSKNAIEKASSNIPAGDSGPGREVERSRALLARSNKSSWDPPGDGPGTRGDGPDRLSIAVSFFNN